MGGTEGMYYKLENQIRIQNSDKHLSWSFFVKIAND